MLLKRKTLTPEQLDNFINEAPGEKYLATKVVDLTIIQSLLSSSQLHNLF